MTSKSLLTIPILLWLTGMAAAGVISDKAGEAEKLLEAGDHVAALEALDAAADAIWTAMPLTIRKAVLVDSSSGYGIYAPREEKPYAQEEDILIYVEPLGFAYGRDSLGGLQIAFDTDMSLVDEDGEEVLVREDFLSTETPVRYRNREFNLSLTLNLTGAPAGVYTAIFLLKDRHSDKTAEFSVPFEIGE